MQRLSIFQIAIIIFSFFSSQIVAAGFDCEQAKTEIEKKICSRQSLNKMDGVITVLYQKLLKTEHFEAYTQEQKKWLNYRDENCSISLARCEQIFAQRINELSSAINAQNNPIKKGMRLPDTSLLDEVSKEALGDHIYRPWPRKRLVDFRVDLLDIARTDNDIFIYYTDDEYLYEYSLTKQTNHVVIYNYPSNTFTDKNNLFLNVAYKDYEGISFLNYVYAVGSQKKPEGFRDIPQKNYNSSVYMTPPLSPDNKMIMLANRNEIDKKSETIKQKIGERDKGLLSGQTHTISIYHNDTQSVTVMPGTNWDLHSVAWAPDSSSIFFDNHSPVIACIWEYKIEENRIEKIIPEHYAIRPIPFSFKGQDYIVYLDSNEHDARFADGRGFLTLAARP